MTRWNITIVTFLPSIVFGISQTEVDYRFGICPTKIELRIHHPIIGTSVDLLCKRNERVLTERLGVSFYGDFLDTCLAIVSTSARFFDTIYPWSIDCNFLVVTRNISPPCLTRSFEFPFEGIVITIENTIIFRSYFGYMVVVVDALSFDFYIVTTKYGF